MTRRVVSAASMRGNDNRIKTESERERETEKCSKWTDSETDTVTAPKTYIDGQNVTPDKNKSGNK